ncbi:MAG: DegV family protein [Bacilli bacterium]|nr:DegV family protein [Bacilli bacterium]
MAKTFEIFIDSTGELNRELRAKYDVDYCPMGIAVGDAEEVPASLDYDAGYSLKDYYDALRAGKRLFTSQVKDHVFEEKFTAALEKGLDVLYISCSSALSASVKAAEKVAEGLMAKFPGRKIVCFDSLIACYGQADMAIRASKMREEGKSLDEIVSWLTENRLRFNQFCTVETLSYLKAAGRVKATAAFFGNLMGVKPIIISDVKGNNNAFKKVKGRKASIAEIVNLAKEAADDIEHQTVYIGHADDLATAEYVKAELLKVCNPGEIFIGAFGPIIGATTGPGTVVIYVFGKEVTIGA